MADENLATDLFDAVSYLINKKIEAIQFDKTKTATIVEDDQADKGIYTVTEDQITKYTAYSSVTEYKVDDTVLVTIPQSNYENQKIIIGKAVSATDTPVIYTPPFGTLVDITNNLITTNLGEFDIWANGYTYQWPISEVKFPGDNEAYRMECIWDSSQSTRAYVDGMGSHLNLSGYSRIGLQVQVATYLGEYETVLGNYGLAMQLFFKVPNLVDGENTFSKFVNFDSSEFFGNIYSFDSYRTQEVVYDLSEYQDFVLDRIKLFIYQRVNFKDKNGNMIEAPQDEYTGHNIAPNISFKDFYICTGIPAEGFESDTIELICNNNNDYYKNIQPLDMPTLAGDLNYIIIKQNFNDSNIKPSMVTLVDEATLSVNDIREIVLNSTDPLNIYNALIQILKIDTPSSVMTPEDKTAYISKYGVTEDQYNLLKDVYPALPSLVNYIGSMIGRETYNQKDVEAIWLHKDDSLGTVARVEEGALPLNYTIRWYRHDIGAQSPDPWAGAHWRRFYGCREEPDDKLDYCITEQEISTARLNNENIDIATDSVRVVFRPNVNNAEEQLKAILLYNEFNDEGEVVTQRFIAASKPIIFYNKDEVRNQATIIDLNTLAIRIEDEECGKYFLYNRADDLPEGEINEIRVLTAVFDPDEPDIYKKPILTDFTSIEWTFPTDNTMIIPATDATKGAVQASTNIFTGVVQVGYFIKPHLDRYATNNTVQVKVIKDGLSWEAECSFIFGTAGTSGSDYTLVLNWRNINKVLDVTYPGWDSLKGEVGLQDRTGKYITIPTGSELEYDWLVSEIPAQNPSDLNYDFVIEDLDLYYPIFESSSHAIFDRDEAGDLYSNYRDSDNATYGGYYYYLDNGYTNLLTALSKASKKNFSYSSTNGFDAYGNSNITTLVDDVAFFDLNKKKFIPIDDGSISNISTYEGNVVFSYTGTEDKNVRVKQFYRKRRNKISLTDANIVNQNEVFFQDIYDNIFYEDIYEKLLTNMNFWPIKEDETLNIQNQDNILNLGKLQIDKENQTYSIGEDLVNFLNEEHSSNFKNDLMNWINIARNQSYKKNNEIQNLEQSEKDKMLVELIFNLKNIYEYVLNKSNFSLSSLTDLKYYFYDKNSKQFLQIAQYPGAKSDLFDNSIVLYSLAASAFNAGENTINNTGLLQYEFPKPKLEYKPLTLLNTTNKISQQTDPYENDNKNKIFDINLKVISNSNSGYTQALQDLFFGERDGYPPISFLSMFNIFKEKDSKFKKRNQIGRNFSERSFWSGKSESLLNDYFAIREYYFYLLSEGQEKWSYDYSTDENPRVLSQEEFKLAFCQEFFNDEALAVANFPEKISLSGQRVDSSKFQSLVHTYLLYEDDIVNTYRNIDNELLNNNSNLKNYYKNNLSKLTDTKYFYTLNDYSEEEGYPNWWQSIYKILCEININSNLSLSNFVNNYFYEAGSVHKLKLKQKKNLSEEKGIWLDGDGIKYITDKLREGYNLVDFYNEYLSDYSTATVKFLTGVDGTENLLESFLEDYFVLLTNIFDVNTNGLKNKIKGLILNQIISANGVTDQAKNYNLLKTPTDAKNSSLPYYNTYLIKTGNSDFPYEQLSQFLQQSLNSYNIYTKTPLADTFKLYQNLYNALNNIQYYENFQANLILHDVDFYTFLNQEILFTIDNLEYEFSNLDISQKAYLNELFYTFYWGSLPVFTVVDGQMGLKIYNNPSQDYEIRVSGYQFILKGSFKENIEAKLQTYGENLYGQNFIGVMNTKPDTTGTSDGVVQQSGGANVSNQRCYYIKSISNFAYLSGDRTYDIFPSGEISPTSFITNLTRTIYQVRVQVIQYRRNRYIGQDAQYNAIYGWNEVSTQEITIQVDDLNLSLLKMTTYSNDSKKYSWLYESENNCEPYEIWDGTLDSITGEPITQNLDFVTLTYLLTGMWLNDIDGINQLTLWMRCLNNFASRGRTLRETPTPEPYLKLNKEKLLDENFFIKKTVVNEETGLSGDYYYKLNDDFSKYIDISHNDRWDEWSSTKLQELAQLILKKYLYEGVTRVDSGSSEFSLYTFNNPSTQTPYKCYGCSADTTSSNKPEEILYNLLLKNPQTNISYTELSQYLYTNSNLFWQYFSYTEYAGDLGSSFDYRDLNGEIQTSYSKIYPIEIGWGEVIKKYYLLDTQLFQQFTINDAILPAQYPYHSIVLLYTMTEDLSWMSNLEVDPGTPGNRLVPRSENHIVYYIAFHLENLRKQAIVSNLAPVVEPGGSYEGLTDEALKEYQLSRIELQDKFFTSQSFSFISKFYNSLNQYIQVATQILNRSNETDFLRFKIAMYEFLSNQELENNTSSFVNGKLREYFEDNPMPYLIDISNLNNINDNESIFTAGSNSYDVVLVNTTPISGKLYLYNLNKLIKNISSENWLYQLFDLLSKNKLKTNPAQAAELVWNKVCYLNPVEDYRVVITSYFTKELESNINDKINELDSQMNGDPIPYYLNGETSLLKYWGNHRPSVTSITSDYKILYGDNIRNLSDVFENEYLTVNKLYDKYYNVFMKNTIYTGDVSSLEGKDTKYFNYYNAGHYKAFINVDGQYILDPYDNWIEEETYYEPIQVKEYACKISPLKFVASKANKNDSTNTLIEIYPKAGFSAEMLMKSLSILKITLTKFGNHDLVAYFPIPLRNGTEVTEDGQVTFEAKYIEGASEVRYTSGGTTEYNKNPYRLFIRTFDNANGNVLTECTANESQSKDRTGVDDNPNWNWGILIPSYDKYNIETANFVPHIVKRLLEPSPVYIPNASAYAVQYYDMEKHKFLWNQPILSYEDNYPSTTLNGWNGEDILTDNDTGTIVASAFAAGKKERDNTFTGLMLGDWGRKGNDTDKAISKQTGIYGFYHGSMAYAFKDDGTGFIGRDGRGRIYFNGQNSTIYSSEWIGNEPLGMLLDLDDGVIQLNSKAYNTTLSSLYTDIYGQSAHINVLGKDITATVLPESREDLGSSNMYKYITISAAEDHYPLAIGTTAILSQRKFKVAWDGTTYIEDGVFSGILHAKGGILDNDFIVNGTLYGGTLAGGTLYAAALYANYGQIGPWIITPAGLVNEDNSTCLLGSTPDIVVGNSDTGESFTMKGANNPYSASIVTNRISLQTTGVTVNADGSINTSTITGALGYLQGHDGFNVTQGIGLASDDMVTVKSTGADVGIKAKVQLHLEGGKDGDNRALAYIQVNHSLNPEIGTSGIVLHGTGIQFYQIPAENQQGIYARFA